jgi:hypothetical protein
MELVILRESLSTSLPSLSSRREEGGMYPFYTRKQSSDKLLCELHARILNKDHLDPKMRGDLTLLASQVNPMSKGRSGK